MPEALGTIGLDPNQIRLQLSQTWQGKKANDAVSAESFSEVMWHTILKQTLDLKMTGGGEGNAFAGSMYNDWIKEGFSAAIAAQLAKQNPLPMPGTEAGARSTQTR